jgi:threonine/homoserine/homoserine lactone efflux protein
LSSKEDSGMELTRVLTFAAVSLALIAVPGPNLIYIVTRSVSQGTRAGLVSALGVETGTLVYVTATALGLSSLIARSAAAFAAVRWAGAGYLLYLGVRAARRPRAADRPGDPTRLPLRRVYRDGALVNVLNPKVAVFFVAFLPQFTTPGASAAAARWQMLALGAVFFALALAMDLLYGVAGGAVSHWLQTRRSRRSPHASPARPRRGSQPRPDRPRGWFRWAVAAIYLGLGTYAALSR